MAAAAMAVPVVEEKHVALQIYQWYLAAGAPIAGYGTCCRHPRIVIGYLARSALGLVPLRGRCGGGWNRSSMARRIASSRLTHLIVAHPILYDWFTVVRTFLANP